MINLLHQELFIKNKIIVEYSEQENTSRLKRKEKVCHEIKHSSYYVFLESMQSHLYDYMIDDESYGIYGDVFLFRKMMNLLEQLLLRDKDHRRSWSDYSSVRKGISRKKLKYLFCDIYHAFYIYLLFLIC